MYTQSHDDLYDLLGMKYYFTSYGDVYAGVGHELQAFPGCIAIIQNDHLRELAAIPTTEWSKETIERSGWLIPKTAIVKTSQYRLSDQDNRNHKPVYYQSGYERKDMFIFGAGASAFCCPNDTLDSFRKDNLCPPLGNELFARRFKDVYRQYGGVIQSINELSALSINVEEFLEEEWKEVLNGNSMVMSRHINIQFYLQMILMQVSQHVCYEYFDSNLYSRLARKLQILQGRNPLRRFGLVSFNQDTLLEHFFCQQFKYKLDSLDDYVNLNEAPFSIFKPHGSWNWGWPFHRFNGNMQSHLYDADIDYYRLYFQYLGEEKDMIDWFSFGLEAMFHEHRIGRLTINKWKLQLFKDDKSIGQYFPALLIPYRDKDELTFPANHYDAMSSFIGQTETLYLIGWKGNERIFNKILLNDIKQLKTVVIADPASDNVESNLSAIIKRFNPQILRYKTFDDFVQNHEIK